MLNALEGDVLREILSRMPGITIARLARTSVALRDAARDEGVWLAVLERSFGAAGDVLCLARRCVIGPYCCLSQGCSLADV